MENAVVLAGNAQTHPTASLILGVIVIVAIVGFLAWLLTK